MHQEFDVIELEIDREYYLAVKTLADREKLSVEQYLCMIMDRYLEKCKTASKAQTGE